MVTTLDRLILDQVIYSDLDKLVNKDFTLEGETTIDEAWNDLIDDTLDYFNRDVNSPDISREKIEATLEKYKIVRAKATESNGFYAGAFLERNVENPEMVIAIRGSRSPHEILGNEKDFIDDWLQVNLGELPLDYDDRSKFNRLDSAYSFYQDIKENEVYESLSITGHSMGGALSQSLAVKIIDESVANGDEIGKNLLCETFNGPGMLHSLSDASQEAAKLGRYDNIMNYVNKEDLVGGLDLLIETNSMALTGVVDLVTTKLVPGTTCMQNL